MTTDLHTLFRELLADPATQAAYDADPAGWLASRGHDLPEELVREAVGQVAAGLPAETAEALSPFVMADSPVPTTTLDDEMGDIDGLGLLRSVEVEPVDSTPADAVEDGPAFGRGADGPEPVAESAPAFDELDSTDPIDLDQRVPESSLDDPFAGLDDPDPALDLATDAEPLALDADDPADLDGFE